MSINVAMDGPVGAGKSSVARESAKRLGFIYVDTGALYRSVGLYCKRRGVDFESENSAEKIGEAIKNGLSLNIKLIGGTQHVFINNEDVSEEIRLPEVSMLASKVSAVPAVRAFLLNLQRDIAAKNDVIMDGRDIGTVILPNAEVKIYITASAEIRAKRRFDELVAKGIDVKFEDVLSDLNKRDYDDMHRETAPLKQANDAILLDTSALNFEGSVDAVINLVKRKMK